MRIHPARRPDAAGVGAAGICGVATPAAAQTTGRAGRRAVGDATRPGAAAAHADHRRLAVRRQQRCRPGERVRHRVGPHADADTMLAYTRRAGRASFGLNGQSVLRHSHAEFTPMRQQGGIDVRIQRRAPAVPRQPEPRLHAVLPVRRGDTAVICAALGVRASRSAISPIPRTTRSPPRPTSNGPARSATRVGFRRTTTGAARPSTSPIWTWSRRAPARAEPQDHALLLAAHRLHLSHRRHRLRGSNGTAAPPRSRPRRRLQPAGAASGRTTVSFGTGTSVTPQDDGFEYRLTGDAAVNRLLGRTWNARVGVNRSVQLLEGFAEPVLANIVNLGLGGTLHRRVSVLSWGSMSTGTVGLTAAEGNGYANWSAGGGLSVMVGRRGQLRSAVLHRRRRVRGWRRAAARPVARAAPAPGSARRLLMAWASRRAIETRDRSIGVAAAG